jgi:8-oxo-dGTP pyrophosphatase MutT (NUDIX family)
VLHDHHPAADWLQRPFRQLYRPQQKFAIRVHFSPHPFCYYYAMKDQLRLAGCILINSRGHILLLHRIKRDQWEIPGGKIDEIVNGQIVRSGATAEATVERELKEELCVDVEIVKRLGDREFSEDQYVMHYTWYLGKIKGEDEPAIGEPEKYDGLRAFSLTDLQHMRDQLSGNTKNFADAWAAGEFTLSSAS